MAFVGLKFFAQHLFQFFPDGTVKDVTTDSSEDSSEKPDAPEPQPEPEPEPEVEPELEVEPETEPEVEVFSDLLETPKPKARRGRPKKSSS